MKIEIDVSDFYLDEWDDSLEEGLKKHITNEAIATIFSKIKDKVEVEIKQGVEAHVLANLSSEIAKAVNQGKIQTKAGNASVTISEYVKDCLFNSLGAWQSFDKTIREVAKSFCDEMRKRYDLSFASNIVANLVENKLIKEDAIKMLLGENLKQKDS